MRKRYEELLKELFRQWLRHDRERLGITRVAMARRLRMAERSYLDLEYGTYSCGALTLMLYLAFLCDDPEAFIRSFRETITKEDAR